MANGTPCDATVPLLKAERLEKALLIDNFSIGLDGFEKVVDAERAFSDLEQAKA